MDTKKPDTNSETVAGKQANDPKVNSAPVETDQDFVITEASSGPQDLVGLDKEKRADDDLGLQSTSTLMEESANDPVHTMNPNLQTEEELFDEPIGSSTPMLPGGDDQTETSALRPQPSADNEPNEVRRLSEKEVISIRNRLYAETEAAKSPPQQTGAISNQTTPVAENRPPRPDPKPFGNTPIDPSANRGQTPTADAKPDRPMQQPLPPLMEEGHAQRRIAHFYNSFIHLPSGTKVRENDELTLRNKLYVMKKKKLSPGLVLGVTAPIFAVIVMLVISIFVGGDTGNGRVIGVVVDDYGVPYNGGATVRFPDLDKSYQTDLQGFFTTDQLPAGSHQIEYIVAGSVVGTEFATVVDDDLTHLIISPSVPESESATAGLPSPVPAKTDYSAPPKMAEQKKADKPPKKAPSKKTKKATKPKTAKLVLATNIEGATLKIDGQVVGVGNTTYSRLKPGQREYSVTRKGFDTVTGSITLKAGSRETLSVQLSPVSAQAKAEIFSAEDYFYSGEELVSSGNFAEAIKDYSSAIDLNPGYAAAYLSRGQANQKTGEQRAAFDDYLRAGEILQIQRSYNNAATAFSRAMDIYPKAIEPVLGRGHTYLSKGESIAAITDFERATDINDKSPAARFGLGVARFNHGQYKKAVNEFKKARSLDPGDPATHQYLMLAYMARNDTKNVRKSYDNFLKHATKEQIVAFHSNKRLTAVVRVIDMED